MFYGSEGYRELHTCSNQVVVVVIIVVVVVVKIVHDYILPCQPEFRSCCSLLVTASRKMLNIYYASDDFFLYAFTIVVYYIDKSEVETVRFGCEYMFY